MLAPQPSTRAVNACSSPRRSASSSSRSLTGGTVTPRILPRLLPHPCPRGAKDLVGPAAANVSISSATRPDSPLRLISPVGSRRRAGGRVGAAMGIAALIAVLGASTTIDDFRRAWTLIAVTGAVAALTAVALGRVRARHVAGLALSEPAPSPTRP